MTDAQDELKVTHVLEMSDPSRLCAKRCERPDFEVRRVELALPELNWFMHEAVGAKFRWTGRDGWSPEQWAKYVDRPELETWIGYVAGTPVGYYELEKQDDDSVCIDCFGLIDSFFGQGLGGALLTQAVQRCWAIGANRVWLSTCSHDHPNALANYLARGFKVVNERAERANPVRTTFLFRTTQ